MEMYEIYQQRITECDQELQRQLAGFAGAPFRSMRQKQSRRERG